MKITFNGASKLVTGSQFLLDVDNKKILIDMGMFQGETEDKFNFHPLNFDPTKIDALILTHAHLDHSGLIPLLVKNGFRGPIYSTIQTKEIAETILLDSAKIQEINLLKKISSSELYNTQDALLALSLFQEVNFFNKITFMDLSFTFLPVGHVLGASSVFIETSKGSILFSGDIGRKDQSIIKGLLENSFQNLSPNYIVMESLYSGQSHDNKDSCNEQLLNIIKETVERNGTVYIPVFALHRAQEMLNILKHFFLNNLLDESVQVYLDSPMAIKITNIYKNNSQLFSNTFLNLNLDQDPFNFNNLTTVKKSKKSLKISNKSRSIILAGSGMAEGGRIVRHLYSNISKSENSIVFVGYQAEGTLGRTLCSGIKKIFIENNEVNVKSKIYQLHGYSAHGDNEDLLFWLDSFNKEKLNKVFLVHAEIDRLNDFQNQLNKEGIQTHIPEMFEEVDLL